MVASIIYFGTQSKFSAQSNFNTAMYKTQVLVRETHKYSCTKFNAMIVRNNPACCMHRQCMP
eukprot:SAG31_NODE_3134_length_4638_cov_2.457810_4_plen_62_part_00